jgi:hypothetical protein
LRSTFNLDYYKKLDTLDTMERKVTAARERFTLLATELSKLRMAVVEIMFEGHTLRKLGHDVIVIWIRQSTEVLKPRGLVLGLHPSSAKDSNAEKIFKLCKETMIA